MPMINFHSARLKDPDQYDMFRYTSNKFGLGRDAVWGIKKGPPRKIELQAIRFDASKYTVADCKKWLKDHKIHWIAFEPASGKEKQAENIITSHQLKVQIPRNACSFMESVATEKRDGKRRFTMVANSGEIMENHSYWGNFAIDLAGIQIATQTMPVLWDHNSMAIVGWSEKVLSESALVVEGVFSTATEAGKQALALAEEGFPWQASVYVPPLVIERVEQGEEVEVNGHTLKGPGTIFRKCKVREASFCALGADENTSASALSEELNIESNVEFLAVREGESENG